MTIPGVTQVHREAGGRDALKFPKKSVNKNSKSHSLTESPWATGAPVTGPASQSRLTEFSKAPLQKNHKENKSRTLTSQGQTREESYLRNKGRRFSTDGWKGSGEAHLLLSPGSATSDVSSSDVGDLALQSAAPAIRLSLSYNQLQDTGFKGKTEGLKVPIGGRKPIKHAQDLGFCPSTSHHPVKERRF